MTAAARAEVTRLARVLGPDEVRVLAWLGRRLVTGEAQYGRLRLATDPRDFEQERAEELADALVYTAMSELRRVAGRRGA